MSFNLKVIFNFLQSQEKSTKGFTLIELSIILTIISFGAINAVTINKEVSGIQQVIDTTKQLQRIQKSLNQYVSAFGHLPCPSDPQIPLNNIDSGDGKGTNGALGCTGSLEFSAGVAGQRTAIGGVPVRNLGLRPDDMMDRWGNRIIYAVDERAIKSTSYENTPSFGITVLRKFDYIVSFESQIDSYVRTRNAGYVLMSYGKDEIGAHNRQGEWSKAVPTNTLQKVTTVPNSTVGHEYDSLEQVLNHRRYAPDGTTAYTSPKSVFIKPDVPLRQYTGGRQFDDLLVYEEKIILVGG